MCQLYSTLVKAWKSCISPGLSTHLEELKTALSCIASNGRSLKVLNIGNISLGLDGVKIICDNCVELKEFSVNLRNPIVVSYFCENLTPEIRKLNIFSCPVSKRSERFFEWADLSPAQFEKLTKRCNKLIALSIIGTITINGISNIMKNLSQTLEKIRVGLTTHGWRSEQGNFLKGIVNKSVRR